MSIKISNLKLFKKNYKRTELTNNRIDELTKITKTDQTSALVNYMINSDKDYGDIRP